MGDGVRNMMALLNLRYIKFRFNLDLNKFDRIAWVVLYSEVELDGAQRSTKAAASVCEPCMLCSDSRKK